MAPFSQTDSVSVLSTQVLSQDGKSVLVETGHGTPLRWFLERGNIYEDDDIKAPAPKRLKTAREPWKRHKLSPEIGSDKEIVLGRFELDLRLSAEPLTARRTSLKHEDETTIVPVDIKEIEQDDDVLILHLANLSKGDGMIKIQASRLSDDRYAQLQTCIDQRRRNEHRPASRYRCFLHSTTTNPLRSVKLEATVSWLNEASAFPPGASAGRTTIYEDYELYARSFPDTVPTSTDSQAWTPQDFYESVHTTSTTDNVELETVIDTPLFPFQKRTVRWMLGREGAGDYVQKDLMLYHEGQDAYGETIWHSPLEGKVSRHRPDSTDIAGGILAEEMGLGKTVEITALIVQHPFTGSAGLTVHDTPTKTDLHQSKATLIITPPTILNQWKSELSQHAPELKVYVYTGISSIGDGYEKEMLDTLTNDYDVVLTTYAVLGKEVHFATDPPERYFRHAQKYERKRSLLVKIKWWRICLDEAQMVESGVAAAARVACRLPRVNSWAVSGTPVKKKVEDLYGLLVFLRLEPFASTPSLWNRLILQHRQLFKEIFGAIALRHTKSQIRDDIQLPPQKRVVMSLPFTAVESQHYSTLFQEMCEEVGVHSDGSPASESWDPNDPKTIETMRSWLTRLRQTCLHPQVGGKNRKRLGRGQGPLRTVAEVLDVMIEQNETQSRAEERLLIQAAIQKAHVIGNAKDDQQRSVKALELYKDAQAKCEVMVKEARDRLKAAQAEGVSTTLTDDEDSSSESHPLAGRLRNALRGALQLLHVCIYFAATATYQIKANVEITEPDSDAYKELEAKEAALYEHAKQVRKEILQHAADKSERAMGRIKDLQDSVVQFPTIEDFGKLGGIESRRIITGSYDLFELIRDITPFIEEIRAKIMDSLTKSLVDEDEQGNEITGDEYEESTKLQDELYVYFDALKALQADLTRCITGETAPLIDHEARGLLKAAKRWINPEIIAEVKEQPHAPELIIELFDKRKELRSKLDVYNSIRGLIADARRLQEPANLGARAAAESEIAEKLLTGLQPILSGYTKALAALQKEVDLCRTTQNIRLEFYRQLQEISDDVAPYKEELDETVDAQALETAFDIEESYKQSLAQLKTKHRFLLHLKQESTSEDNARICVICQCPFENGVLTVCGHTYCKECIQLWWNEHRTCPVCKRKLALVDFHSITYKPKEVRVQEEKPTIPEDNTNGTSLSSTSIYSTMDDKLRDEIKEYDLPASYGTKIDTLARHLLWIRDHDPGAKSIVFSQYREFLDVLTSAFADFKIGFARLGKQNAVDSFRKNASVDCLLLDAKTDSSGLTLVNATHVFICEPLVQTAVELQAVARVHRIGQTRPTTVWMYLVNDTVEESIYEISVQRRLAHVQARQKGKHASGSSTPAVGESAIDAANSEQLQNAALAKLLTTGKNGGEVVEKRDLWQCLFGKTQKSSSMLDATDAASEFGRNLRAHAAKSRASAA